MQLGGKGNNNPLREDYIEKIMIQILPGRIIIYVIRSLPGSQVNRNNNTDGRSP